MSMFKAVINIFKIIINDAVINTFRAVMYLLMRCAALFRFNIVLFDVDVTLCMTDRFLAELYRINKIFFVVVICLFRVTQMINTLFKLCITLNSVHKDLFVSEILIVTKLFVCTELFRCHDECQL